MKLDVKKKQQKSCFNSLDPSSILEYGRKDETKWNSAFFFLFFFLHEVTWWQCVSNNGWRKSAGEESEAMREEM